MINYNCALFSLDIEINYIRHSLISKILINSVKNNIYYSHLIYQILSYFLTGSDLLVLLSHALKLQIQPAKIL